MSQTLAWIRQDWKSNPIRFLAEVFGFLFNFIAATLIAITSPNPPMFYAYIFYIMASVLLIFAAYSRKSTGFTVMYVMFLSIDGIGFVNAILAEAWRYTF
tara:strand:+ start:410 stop:709 length:300 start_codon:yes stop_codon:yes gene_type:complete